MPQFDLKKANVYFIDGFKTTGAVNNTSGYVTGTTTMKMDGTTVSVPKGATFTLAGDDQIYEVTDKTDTLGATTSVTFTPGLIIAATDNEVMTFDGVRLRAKIGEGNITYDEKRTMEYKKDRGLLDNVREGDQEPIDVRLDIQWEFLVSNASEPPTPEEALKNEGNASTWVASGADPCEPYSVDLLIVYTPHCSGVKAELIRLPEYRYESLNHDAKAGTLSTSGKCNVTKAVISRSLQAIL